jgi:hypothetical protein
MKVNAPRLFRLSGSPPMLPIYVVLLASRSRRIVQSITTTSQKRCGHDGLQTGLLMNIVVLKKMIGKGLRAGKKISRSLMRV